MAGMFELGPPGFIAWLQIMGHFIMWPVAVATPIVIAVLILRRWVKWPISDLATYVTIAYFILCWVGSCALPCRGY